MCEWTQISLSRSLVFWCPLPQVRVGVSHSELVWYLSVTIESSWTMARESTIPSSELLGSCSPRNHTSGGFPVWLGSGACGIFSLRNIRLHICTWGSSELGVSFF